MQRDADFQANSRRVRLEALANYCTSALKFLDSGVYRETDKPVFEPPNLAKLTSQMPGLDDSIRRRWMEAQKCQHSGCHLSAVILMGSIIEALLLARVTLDPAAAGRSQRAPKDRSGVILPFYDWKLTALIEVAADVGWIKADRARFSHALRESRNIVHPYAEVQSRSSFDDGTSKTCWQVVNAAVDDVLASV